MEKYLGIVKRETESEIGIDIKILTRFSNSKSLLKQWTKLYPKAKNIILENTAELDCFFKDFEDVSSVTEEEKKEAKKLYNNCINDEQKEYHIETKGEDGHYHCPICYAYVYDYESRCCECGAKIKFNLR